MALSSERHEFLPLLPPPRRNLKRRKISLYSTGSTARARTNGSVAAHIPDWLNRTRTHTHTYTLYLFTCIHNVAFAHCSHTADPRFHDAAFRSFALMPRLPSSCSFFSHCLSQTPSSIFACPALLTKSHTPSLSITPSLPTNPLICSCSCDLNHLVASPRYWPCLEFELDAVACRGLEHFFGGIVEVVVLDAVSGGGGKGEKVS